MPSPSQSPEMGICLEGFIEKDKKINQLDDQLQEKDKKIDELNKISQNVKQMEIIISELEKIKITNESLINSQSNEIYEIKNSKTWKALQYYINVKKTLTGKP